MTTTLLPPIVAAGMITDSLGREWDPLEHPRGRDGRFIHTFKRIRAFLNGTDTDPWMTGEVTKINPDGSVRVRISKTTDPNLVDPASGKSYINQQVDLTPDLVESINEKAVLDLDGSDKAPSAFAAKGWGGELVTWKSYANRFKFGQMGSKVNDDTIISTYLSHINDGESPAEFTERLRELGENDIIANFSAKQVAYMAGLRLRSEHLTNDNTFEGNEKFRRALSEMGVPEEVIDDTPDGMSGVQWLADQATKARYGDKDPMYYDVVPMSSDVVREMRGNKSGKRMLFKGLIHGSGDAEIRVADADQTDEEAQVFPDLVSAREYLDTPDQEAVSDTGQTPPSSPKPNKVAAPDPDLEPDEFDQPEEVDPPVAELDEVAEDDVEQFADVDTSEIRELGESMQLSKDTEYGEEYSTSIIAMADGIEQNAYDIQDARNEIINIANEIDEEGDDFDNPALKKFAQQLKAAARRLGVTQKADLTPELDAPQDVVDEQEEELELPDTDVNNPLNDEEVYEVKLPLEDFMPEDDEWYEALQVHGLTAEETPDDDDGEHFYASGTGKNINDFIAKNSALEFADPHDYVVDSDGDVDVPEDAIDEPAPEDINVPDVEENVGPLTAIQAKYLEYYGGMGARKLNKVLRANQSGNLDDIPEDTALQDDNTTNVHEMTKTLDDLIDSQLEVGTYKVVYRGMSINTETDQEFLDSLVPGATIVDKAFMSTSTNMDVAESFSDALPGSKFKTVRFSLNVGEGLHAINMDSLNAQMPGAYVMGEEEFLFGRNVQTFIEDVQLDNDGNYTIMGTLKRGDNNDSGIPGADTDSEEESAPQDSPVEAPNPEAKPDGPADVDAGPGDSDSSEVNEPFLKPNPETVDDPWADVEVNEDEPTWVDKAMEEEPLAEWEKELLYGDDYVAPTPEPENDGQIAPFDVPTDAPEPDLPGPDSEDWEKMVDADGAFRYDQDGNKLYVGSKVIGADGVEMTISKFENNNKGVIALDANGKKRIRHRKKLSLVAPDAPGSAPDDQIMEWEKELLAPDPASTPEPAPVTPEVYDTTPSGTMVDYASWADDTTSDFSWKFDGFINTKMDGGTSTNDYFDAGDGYSVTFDPDAPGYQLWHEDDDAGLDLIDTFPATTTGVPVDLDLGEKIQQSIKQDWNKNSAAPTVLSTVDWSDSSELLKTMIDVKLVAQPGSWSSDQYVDLGEGYQLHYDADTNNLEVWTDADEILTPPVGSPSFSAQDLTNNVQSRIASHKGGYNDPDEPAAPTPIVVTVDTAAEFDTAVADLLERISNAEYGEGDKIVHDGYHVEYDPAGGNLQLVYPPTGETLVEVDVGEDFDVITSQLAGAIYTHTYGGPPGDASPTPSGNLDVPEPSGNMHVFSTWENDPETFAYDFEGFVNSVSDGALEPGDYFDAGDGYNVTHDPISNNFVLWNMNKPTNTQLIDEIPNDGDAAATIQSAIKELETGEVSPASAPTSAPQVYSSADELAKINDIPLQIGSVKKLFPSMSEYQAKQYRNAGYALKDASSEEVDSVDWNSAVNKAIYNLTQSGPDGSSKLAQINEWRTDSLNALHGGVIDNDSSGASFTLPDGYAPAPAGTKSVYVHSANGPSPVYATVDADGVVTYQYNDGDSISFPNITEEVLKNHPAWTPFNGTAVTTPGTSSAIPGPDLSKPHKLDLNGNAMFIGDKVYWTTKGVEVTITGFENNDVGVIATSIGPNGKPKKHALNRKKLKLVSSPSQTAKVAPNKPSSPPSIIPSGVVTKKPDPNPDSPLFGQPAPEKPALVDIPDAKPVSDGWMEKVNQNYKKGAKAENPNWIEKDLSQSLTYSEYTKAQNGDKNALQSLFSKGWLTKELYEDALAEIQVNGKAKEEALAANSAKLSEWRAETKEWRAANGLPTIELKGMDDGVLKFNNADAVAWMNKNQAPGGLTPAGKLTGQALSGINSQKGSNISGALRAAKEKTLDPQWIADNASYVVLGADQAMIDSPPLAEDFMVTRTLDMNNFIDPDTGLPFNFGDSLSGIAGSIQHDWGFAETSVGSYDAGATVGYGHGRAIKMQLRVPKGTRGVWTEHPNQPFGYDSERGFILERGIAYYIHSVEYVGGYWRVNAEIIPKDVNYDEYGHFINENPFFN